MARWARWRPSRRSLLALVGGVFVLATFAYFLPKIADYRDVWAVLQEISWAWIAVLAGVAILNLLTFAPPWQAALPGLRFRSALLMTQVSTALAIVVPAGAAVGLATTYGILRRWAFPRQEIGRAITLVSLWNQFANLSYPVIAVFLLAVSGGDSPLLATAAFVGAIALGVALAAFAVVLSSNRAASGVGDLVARTVDSVGGRFGRRPVSWDGASFGRFRAGAVDLLRRRWHVLTIATYAGTLAVFLVLLASLRALEVPASEVSLVEAFAAWSLARLLGTIPITPGGIGVVELGLTAALLGFGGSNAGVVAAVLLYRFLTMVPTIATGLVAAPMVKGSGKSPGSRSQSEDVLPDRATEVPTPADPPGG